VIDAICPSFCQGTKASPDIESSNFRSPDHFPHQTARIAHRICGMVSSCIDQKKAERQPVIAKGALTLKPD
jgi:hypothetical protein